jgi:hypothetical protein
MCKGAGNIPLELVCSDAEQAGLTAVFVAQDFCPMSVKK